jgi:hypothetical protein
MQLEIADHAEKNAPYSEFPHKLLLAPEIQVKNSFSHVLAAKPANSTP